MQKYEKNLTPTNKNQKIFIQIFIFVSFYYYTLLYIKGTPRHLCALPGALDGARCGVLPPRHLCALLAPSMVPGMEYCHRATFAPSERINPIKSGLTIAMSTGFSAAVGPL